MDGERRREGANDTVALQVIEIVCAVEPPVDDYEYREYAIVLQLAGECMNGGYLLTMNTLKSSLFFARGSSIKVKISIAL